MFHASVIGAFALALFTHAGVSKDGLNGFIRKRKQTLVLQFVTYKKSGSECCKLTRSVDLAFHFCTTKLAGFTWLIVCGCASRHSLHPSLFTARAVLVYPYVAGDSNWNSVPEKWLQQSLIVQTMLCTAGTIRDVRTHSALNNLFHMFLIPLRTK